MKRRGTRREEALHDAAACGVAEGDGAPFSSFGETESEVGEGFGSTGAPRSGGKAPKNLKHFM